MEYRGLFLVSVLALAVVASGCAGGESSSSELVSEGNTLVYDLETSATSIDMNTSLTFTEIGEENYDVNLTVSSAEESESRSLTFSRDDHRFEAMDSGEEFMLYVMPIQTFSTLLNISESNISTLMEDGETIEVTSESGSGTASRSEAFSYNGRRAYNITFQTESSSDSLEFTVSSERPYPTLHFALDGSAEISLTSVRR